MPLASEGRSSLQFRHGSQDIREERRSGWCSGDPRRPERDGAGARLHGRAHPAWRGFNLLGYFTVPKQPRPGGVFDEFDFAAMAEWGFDFARLPLNYWVWGDRQDWSLIRKRTAEGDRSRHRSGPPVRRAHQPELPPLPGILHQRPRTRTGRPVHRHAAQRQQAQDAVVHHWRAFAARYKGVPNRRLSFDLINKPPKMRSYEGYLEERYVEIVKALVAGIREIDPPGSSSPTASTSASRRLPVSPASVWCRARGAICPRR